MAKITAFGQPANEGERDAIYYLRRLPDTFEIFHNLEIKQNQETFEVDLIILAPQCVFVVDVKGTHGQIEVVGSRWHPENRQPYASPVAKLRNIAKVLNTLLKDSNRLKPDLGRVHVHAVTLMIAEDVNIIDLDGRDSQHITYCNEKCEAYFKSRDFIPDHRLKDIRAFFPDIKRAIQGKARAKSSPPRYRDWQVEEELGSTDRYTEYRARHLLMGESGWTARLRVYRADPYQNRAEREAEQKLISNAFKAVYQIPKHSNILNVQEFFASEDGDCFVLVTEDIPGQSLRQHARKKPVALDQKLDFMGEILIALDHAHKHGVIHRNLTPDNILVGINGQIRLIGFDYARICDRTGGVTEYIVDDLEDDAVYQSVECYRDPAKASVSSDLFSAGTIFYELLTGKQAFESAEQLRDRSAIFPLKPSIIQPDLSSGMDAWLQKLCAFHSRDRFSSADAALQELTTLATLQTLDLANLPVGSPIDDRYRVIQKLGRQGSFAVAYKVLDSLDDTVLVLKLVTRDRRSVYERLRQEYKTLRQIPEHPHIVKVIFAGHLKDDTPFIIFEYVEGQDVEQLLELKAITLEKAVQIAQQTAVGLVHLHQHGVYHQDIKPSNLLLTANGVRIIDFNIAVADGDEVTVSAGTRKYMPPDFKLRLEPTTDEKVGRDLYALGITFYECVTGEYPVDESSPSIDSPPWNPGQFNGCEDLSDELVQILVRAIAPKRVDRFSSATEFLNAISSLPSLRKPEEAPIPAIDVEVIPSEQSEGFEAQPLLYTVEAENALRVGSSVSLIASESNSQISYSLFDSFPPASPSAITAGSPLGKSVILDPTGLYSPPSGCTEIKTEVEWMRAFFLVDGLYWVTGKGLQAERLCEWTREWLRVWNKLDAIIEEKQNPRVRLEALFGSVPIPQEWTPQEVLQLATKLDSYPSENSIAHLLADVLDCDQQIWFEQPSINHLAQWLSIQVLESYKPLEQVWQNQIVERAQDLAAYYQTEDKLQLLRQWIGIAKPSAKIKALGCYRMPVPDFLVTEFRAFWERQFLLKEAQILDELTPSKQAGMEQIASLAYSIFKKRPDWLTAEGIRKLSPYLNHQQLTDLNDLLSPPQPKALALEASSTDAMRWVTEQYLPFRRWETAICPLPSPPKISDRLADSFVNWILRNYPDLRLDPADRSGLNYSVASLVQDLCQKSPVLWVVIDGLGWLDHQELLKYLTRNNQFSIETALQPRISILPTKTEYAKWSLYTQLPPSHSSWVPDAGKGFAKMGIGKRYTDHKQASLNQDLKKDAHTLYCWDTDKFDHLYHSQQDWQNLYQVQRPHVLEGIAKEIEYCVKQYPHPEQLKIVIASDHGQMMGETEHLSEYPEGLISKGRMAIGKTDDPRFVVLDAERYGLPHDISVVKGAACLSAFSYTEKNEIIGSHGGLFPEEVVVGVSVLRQFTTRLPVSVICDGEGESGQAGKLELTINNLNEVPLTQLCLYINEFNELRTGYSLDVKVPAGQKTSIQVPISNCPELSPHCEGNQLALTGELRFQFAGVEFGTASLDSESLLTVKQMFSSGLDIDDFL